MLSLHPRWQEAVLTHCPYFSQEHMFVINENMADTFLIDVEKKKCYVKFRREEVIFQIEMIIYCIFLAEKKVRKVNFFLPSLSYFLFL